MDLRMAIGLAAVRLLAGFLFFLIAGLRLGVPSRFPVSRAIVGSAVAAALGVMGPPAFSWPLFPVALLGTFLALYRPSFGWGAAALAAGLAVEGAIRMGIAGSP